MKYYYKVAGKTIEHGEMKFYLLGFCTSRADFTEQMRKNGWNENDLIFIREKVVPSFKQQFINR
jgi:hypothetical protein